MYKLPACPSVILPYFPQLGYVALQTHSGVGKEVSGGRKYALK